MNKIKIIVTGGAGFIGSHLIDILLKNEIEVVCIDNFSTGRRNNLDHVIENNDLTIIEGNINNKALLKKHFAGAKYVFHLAALADIVPSMQNPEEYFEANVSGTLNVLLAAKEANVEKILYSASSSCYGIPDIYPTSEESAIRPMYPYALTKRMGEELVIHFGEIYKLPYISLRLFNVYGTRSRTSGTYGAVFGVFLKQKLEGKPFTVVGDGTQTRDFTYVTDVAAAFYSAAVSDLKNEVMNVGSGHTYSVNNLVELLGGEVVYIPKRPGEPDCTFADTKKIERLLNWSANISLENGVREVVKNIEYWRNAPLWDSENINVATKDWFEFLGKEEV